MQNTGYVSKNAQLSEEEKHKVLQQLVDIFNCSPSKQLRNLCEKNAWNVERCIDSLIKADNDIQRRMGSGAIPKQNISMGEKTAIKNLQNRPSENRSSYIPGATKNQITSSESSFVEQRIIKLISDGFKVMVLMRGPPGSGKSYLAKSFVEQHVPINENYPLNNFIFSSDDFFSKRTGRYQYQLNLLDEAHEFNQRIVVERAQAGWSPIFVDNTNMKLWEMLPYVQTAVEYGYVIEILEPRTTWRNSASKLAYKNIHGVPAERIRKMLNKYEKGTVTDLLKVKSK